MTERRTPYTATQRGLFGNDTVVGDIPSRIAYLLSQHPGARNDYRLLLYYYWLEFDGLADVVPDLAQFRQWLLNRATSPKTIQNRAGEVQNDIPALEADGPVAAYRMRQAKAGVVR